MYYIVEKGSVQYVNMRETAAGVADFMLGRMVSNYIIVKSTEAVGDRVVSFTTYNVKGIEQACEYA
jgi:hypothetical protein